MSRASRWETKLEKDEAEVTDLPEVDLEKDEAKVIDLPEVYE